MSKIRLPTLVVSAGVLASLLPPIASADPLPTAYNVYEGGYLLNAPDQGYLGTCWAFASTTTFQSALLRQGVVTDKHSPLLNISQWHIAVTDGNFLSYTAVNNGGYWEYPGWGSFNEYAVGYWLRGIGDWPMKPDYSIHPIGGGPVLVSEHPLNVYPREAIYNHENLKPYVPPTAQPIAPYGLKQVISYYWDFDPDTLADYQAQVKEALQNYGAVTSVIYASGELGYISPTNEGYISHGETQPNHAITIVGWDDEKVLTIDGETYVGAWLIQNSWGHDWGTYAPGSDVRGYFWIPYADTSISNLKSALALVPRSNEYKDGQRLYSPVVLQNQYFTPFIFDPLGQDVWAMLFETGFPQGTRTIAASKLSAPGSPNSPSQVTLAALGIWQTNPGTTISISIYPEWGPNGPSGTPLLDSQIVTLTSEGRNSYTEVDLDTEITLTLGQSVYVIIDFGDEHSYPVAIDARTAVQLAGQPDFTGVSWISSNGTDWIDLYTSLEYPAIFFLKGITVFYPLPNTGEVSGYLQTYGAETLSELTFDDASELYTNGPLTLTSGSLTVASGTADLRGSTLITSDDLNYTGPGTLHTRNPFQVGGNAIINSGHFSTGNTFVVNGGAFVVATGATAEVGSNGWLIVNSGTAPDPVVPGEGTLTNHGWISGNGQIYATVHNHGVVAPGQSPGVLTVVGDYIQAPNGTYLWEAASHKNYDQLVATGDVVLDGTLAVREYGGTSLNYGDKFRKIISGNTLSGRFRGTDMPSHLRARLFYKPTSVDLLIAPSSYTLLATNPSEHSLAKALDRFIPATKGDRLKVSTALDHLRPEEYRDAFAQIAPHFYYTVSQTGLTLANQQSRLVNQRLDAIRDGSTGLSLQGFGPAPVYENAKQSKEIFIPAPENRWGVWAQASGIFGRNGSVADLPNDRFNSGGVTVGGDYRW